MNQNNNKIAVLIPAYNEEKTIVKVINDFKQELSEADIIVIDNNSNDQTKSLAEQNGAKVLVEKKLSKGNAVRKAFNEISADIYIMVDADDTYPANEVHKLIDPIKNGSADMTVGTRLENFKKENKKFLHNLGNKFFVGLVNFIFKSKYKDIFSGYRVFSKNFVANVPLLSDGFEIESELTIKALERGYSVKEIPITYRERPAGSYSKLRTFSDGWKILLAIFSILRDYRPMAFFSIIALFFIVLGLICGSIVIVDYIQKGIVTRVPFAILTAILIILGFICFIGGFIVSAVNRRFDEIAELNKRKY